MEPIIIPIEDTIDLHTFHPKEISELLDDYLTECNKAGIFSVRIIHGKGQGFLKKRVGQVLAGHPLVKRYQDAPPEAGGWGATLVDLKSSADD